MQTVFPGNLALPASLTFFTVTLRHSGSSSTEPGSFDPTTARWLYQHLDRAADRAAPDSDLRANLEARRAYIEGSREMMSEHPGKYAFVILCLQKIRLSRHEPVTDQVELSYSWAYFRSATCPGFRCLYEVFNRRSFCLVVRNSA